ncbi:MAG: glutathione-disulfide reductase [Sphingomonadaceae bacterium]
MSRHDFDYFVIGAGSGGVRSSRIAAGHGAKVAIAEEFRVGGTCVIRGCVPKKLLVLGAHYAANLADAPRYGWQLGEPQFSWPVLRDAVLNDVDRLENAYRTTLSSAKVELMPGRAIVTGPNRIFLNGRDIHARHILVASGARPHVPNVPGAELGITSNEVFHLEELPRRAVVVGGGYIANEFAGIFNKLGVEVTMLVRGPRLLRGWEEILADRLQAISIQNGMRFCFGQSPTSLARQANGCLRVSMSDGKSLETDLVLWATGRVPNSAGLGLEALGVKLKENGAIPVDAASHTSLPWLHAVGDVTDRIQLTPIAIREGHALADTLFGGKPWTVDHDLVPSAVFSDPPLASIGLTEQQARTTYEKVRVYTADFRPMQHVLSGRQERAHYRLVVDEATDRILGAHMIGPEAPEILQALAIAVKAGLTKAQVDQTVALHPTMAEELVLMK